MKSYLRIFVGLEKMIIVFANILLLIMVLIIFLQVTLRYCFNSGIPWVEEIATICIVWYGFISIGFGILCKEHIAIHSITSWLPVKICDRIDRFDYILISLYGVFIMIYGTRLMKIVTSQTLPATKWSYSVVYASLPFAGGMFIVFALLVATGFVEKHPEVTCYSDDKQEEK